MKKVLIDPGHGGTDPGATAGGVNEADINLDVSLALAWELSRRGIPSATTRTVDTNLSLSERQRMVDRLQPDAFVSIHCNAAPDDPATPQDERLVIKGCEIFYRDPADLPLAQAIHHYLIRTGVKDRGIHQDQQFLGKRLAMLNNLRVPSVLVELGYLSHPGNRQMIRENVQGFAELIAHGVAEFLGVGVGGAT